MFVDSMRKLGFYVKNYVQSIPKEIKLLLLVGFVIRLVGIGWGLPIGYSDMYHPDEQRILGVVEGFPRSIVTNEFFDWPNFIAYFIGLLLMPLRLLLRGLVKLSMLDPNTYTTIIHVFSRFVIVVLGVLTILAVYEYCRRNGNKFTAILAPVLVCFSMFHVQNSSWLTTDVPLSLMVMLSLLVFHNLIKNPSTTNYILSAALTGLVISTKYPGGVILFSFLAAHVMAVVRLKDMKRLFSKEFIISAPFVLLAFLITNPHIFFHFSDAITGISFVSSLSSVPYYYGSPIMAPFNAGNLFLGFSNLSGVIFAILSVAALIYALFKKGKDYPLLVFFLLYTLYFFSSTRIYSRNLIVLIPLAAILVSDLFSYLYEITKKNKFSKGIVSAMLVILLASTILLSGSEVVYRLKGDTRAIASEYIAENIPEGSTIALHVGNEVGWSWQTVIIDDNKHTVVNALDDPDFIVITSLRTKKIKNLFEQNTDFGDPELMKVIWYPVGSDERPGKVPGAEEFDMYANIFNEVDYAVYKEFRKDTFVPVEAESPVITIYGRRV